METAGQSHDPRAEYERRLSARRATVAAARTRSVRLSNLRLVVFVLLLGLFGAALFADWTGHWVWLPLAAFVWLVILHARASAAEVRARRAARIYEAGLARLDGTWHGHGRSGEEFQPPHHVYAEDLDLFGSGSMFELLCAARTGVGEQRLADWLSAPAAPAEVVSRQEAVRELAPRLDLREEMAVAEGEVSSAVERGAASGWGEKPRRLHGSVWPLAHGAAALVSTVLLVTWLSGQVPALWMILAMAIQYALAAAQRATVHEVLEEADRPAQDLLLLGLLLERIEAASFRSTHLTERLARLAIEGIAPSARIRRLGRLMDFVDARRNQIFLPVSFLLSLGTQLAHAIESWRAENGAHLADWLDVVAELEALASLAGFAYEHPQAPFPEIVEEGPLYEGRELAHPLLPADRCVANDVSLSRGGDVPQALLVSGSNMSGKSTLLRTVGVNAVLALAGAPVTAASLRISPLALGASIRLHDSLQEGASRFYAEIARLKRIVDLAGEDVPVLFLMDEILHGTNSHDRRVGAAAVVSALLECGAIGLVTTHDLALADIEQDAGGRLANVHFEDQVDGGEISFDYKLRPGVVERGNALALMRMVGLEVEDED